MRIDAFEDAGAHWHLPLWDITRLQLARGSRRARAAQLAGLQAAVARLRQPLAIAADAGAAARTRRRVAEQRARLAPALAAAAPGLDLDAYVARREGDPRLYAELERSLVEQDLLELDRRLSKVLVSNPASGELVKGHAIVLAELGLCPFEGTVVRDASLFSGDWSRERRADHLIARLAFAQELWAAVGHGRLTLFRATATEAPLTGPRSTSLVSCTFSEVVADAHFAGGASTRHAIKWRQAVDPARLVMTFLETEAFNSRFREAEAVLVGDPENAAF